MIDNQPTEPIPTYVIQRSQEKSQEYYEQLKRISDRTGKRLLFVYLEEQKKKQRY